MKRLSLLLLLGCAVSSTGLASDDDEARIARLSAEHRALAERMIRFIEHADERYLGRLEALNGDLPTETLTHATDYSDFDVLVTRGPIVEKAGRMISVSKKASPGRGDGELVWGRFYSLDFHPKTPLVGMLHATLVLQFFADGSAGVGGWLDVLPGTRIDADLQELKKLTDAHFAAHNKDPSLYRRLVCKGTHDTIAEFRRQPSCSGVSFYGPPVYRENPGKSYIFIEELFEQFVDSHLDIVERRAEEPFTAADLAAQDKMRKRWLIDQLFSDPFSSKIVPFEVWSLANVPPIIKF